MAFVELEKKAKTKEKEVIDIQRDIKQFLDSFKISVKEDSSRFKSEYDKAYKKLKPLRQEFEKFSIDFLKFYLSLPEVFASNEEENRSLKPYPKAKELYSKLKKFDFKQIPHSKKLKIYYFGSSEKSLQITNEQNETRTYSVPKKSFHLLRFPDGVIPKDFNPNNMITIYISPNVTANPETMEPSFLNSSYTTFMTVIDDCPEELQQNLIFDENKEDDVTYSVMFDKYKLSEFIEAVNDELAIIEQTNICQKLLECQNIHFPGAIEDQKPEKTIQRFQALTDKAKQYESASFQGLFHFIQFMENHFL